MGMARVWVCLAVQEDEWSPYGYETRIFKSTLKIEAGQTSMDVPL